MKAIVARHPVLFVIAAALLFQFGIVAIVAFLLDDGMRIHDHETAHMVFRFRVFGPLIASVGVTALIEGRAGLRHLFASFFHWKVPAVWYAFAFTWKFLFTAVGITVLFLVGAEAWPGLLVPNFFGGQGSAFHGLLMNLPFIVSIAIVEETTWIKCCVTRLQRRHSALFSALVVGIFWGLWYLPMLLLGEGVPDGYPWPFFLLSMVSLTVLLTWAYNMTRSGTVLLVMQIISNCCFFIIPVLPAWHDMDPAYVNSFVWVNFASAVTLSLVFGAKHLARRERAKWQVPDAARTEEVVHGVPQPA